MIETEQFIKVGEGLLDKRSSLKISQVLKCFESCTQGLDVSCFSVLRVVRRLIIQDRLSIELWDQYRTIDPENSSRHFERWFAFAFKIGKARTSDSQ